MKPCSLVYWYQHFRGTLVPITKLHGISFHNLIIQIYALLSCKSKMHFKHFSFRCIHIIKYAWQPLMWVPQAEFHSETFSSWDMIDGWRDIYDLILHTVWYKVHAYMMFICVNDSSKYWHLSFQGMLIFIINICVTFGQIWFLPALLFWLQW